VALAFLMIVLVMPTIPSLPALTAYVNVAGTDLDKRLIIIIMYLLIIHMHVRILLSQASSTFALVVDSRLVIRVYQ